MHPQMFADSLAPRQAAPMWELPGRAPQHGVPRVWQLSATRDPGHAWRRDRVRRLFARSP